jgi:hypothetical protein
MNNIVVLIVVIVLLISLISINEAAPAPGPKSKSQSQSHSESVSESEPESKSESNSHSQSESNSKSQSDSKSQSHSQSHSSSQSDSPSDPQTESPVSNRYVKDYFDDTTENDEVHGVTFKNWAFDTCGVAKSSPPSLSKRQATEGLICVAGCVYFSPEGRSDAGCKRITNFFIVEQTCAVINTVKVTIDFATRTVGFGSFDVKFQGTSFPSSPFNVLPHRVLTAPDVLLLYYLLLLLFIYLYLFLKLIIIYKIRF